MRRLPYYMEMNRMVHIILDGNEMQNKEGVHLYLKYKLNIKEYYGNNLDALWDALSTYNHSIKIVLIHSEQMLENLGNYGESIVSVFEDAARENSNIVFQVIED